MGQWTVLYTESKSEILTYYVGTYVYYLKARLMSYFGAVIANGEILWESFAREYAIWATLSVKGEYGLALKK